MNAATDFSWSQECTYIANMADVFQGTRAPDDSHNQADFNYDREVFLNYCQMQSGAAHRAGRHDSVVYIQQVMDDLKER